jgi:8-oxo-dGTP pyrophosphatase MutT (NUDIX family)
MTDEWEDAANPWTVLSRTQPFENDWFRVDQHAVIHPHGEEGLYTVVRMRRLAVGVLPLDEDGQVRLVGQWRFPLARYSWEMPEGGAEPGESAEACARRELAEEAGVAAAELTPILELDMSNSLTDERAVIFLDTGLTPAAAEPDATEVLRRRRAPFMEALNRALEGRIRDSMTVVALLRAHHMAVTGQLPASLARAMLGQGETYG